MGQGSHLALGLVWHRALGWVFATRGRAGGILALLAALPILPLLYLARYAHPSADDYSFLVRGRDFGANYVDLYTTRVGRYASSVLVMANPFDDGGLLAYRAVAALMIVATLVGFVLLFRALLGRSGGWLAPLDLGLLVTAVFLFQLPTLAEGIYWYTGAMVYQAANVLFLLYAASLLRYFTRETKFPRGGHLALNVLLVLVMGGFNEGFTMTLVALHAFGLYKARALGSAATRSWAVLLAASLLAATAVLGAPANSVRGSLYPGSHQWGNSLVFTAYQTVRFSMAWTSTAPVLVGAVLLFFFLRQHAKERPLLREAFGVTPLEGALSLGFVFAINIFPSYWFTGVIGQHRTLNTAYFFFLLVVMLNVAIWAREWRTARLPERLPRSATVLMLLLVIGATGATHNGYDAAYDLVYGLAAGYDAENLARYDAIARGLEEGASQVVVPPLAHRPRTIFVLDATDDPDNWINDAMGDHFGVRIAVEDGDDA